MKHNMRRGVQNDPNGRKLELPECGAAVRTRHALGTNMLVQASVVEQVGADASPLRPATVREPGTADGADLFFRNSRNGSGNPGNVEIWFSCHGANFDHISNRTNPDR
jgi:hypothetical protein